MNIIWTKSPPSLTTFGSLPAGSLFQWEHNFTAMDGVVLLKIDERNACRLDAHRPYMVSANVYINPENKVVQLEGSLEINYAQSTPIP